jgi:hypothetical protein
MRNGIQIAVLESLFGRGQSMNSDFMRIDESSIMIASVDAAMTPLRRELADSLGCPGISVQRLKA